MKTTKQNRFIKASEWSKYHSWPPIGGLRHLILHAETNGFKICITRVGRSVLIDETAFFKWLKGTKHGTKNDNSKIVAD